MSKPLPGKTPKRHFFAVKAEVGETFARMASKRNLTLYSLVSDCLEKIVELDNSGVSLDEAASSFRLLKTAREIGLVLVPESLWYETVESSLKTDRKGTMARFSDTGEWIGKYCLAKNRGDNAARELGSCLAPLASDANDFSLEGDETIRLRCVNPKYSQQYAESFSMLLCKAFETIGHECLSRTVSKGMIILTLHRVPMLEKKMRDEILV